MHMELLIIKTDQGYIRFKEGRYLSVNLDKASVFPLDQLKAVKSHLNTMKTKGFDTARIKRLILTEEDFNQ